MTSQPPATPQPSDQNCAVTGAISARFNDPAAAEFPGPSKRKRPPIRVSGYTADEGLRICERIATTPQSLTRLCQAPDMPSVATLTRWLRNYPEFRETYAFAKQAQVELIFERILEIADDTTQDLIVTSDGRTVPNLAAVQGSQLRIAPWQIEASKLLPRKHRQNSESDQ